MGECTCAFQNNADRIEKDEEIVTSEHVPIYFSRKVAFDEWC